MPNSLTSNILHKINLSILPHKGSSTWVKDRIIILISKIKTHVITKKMISTTMVLSMDKNNKCKNRTVIVQTLLIFQLILQE